MTGERIADRYELLDRLGSGGTASVWRARDEATGAFVAVKLLHLDRAENAEAVARFEREARLLETVDSDHVVRLITHGEHHGRPYMVFLLVDGEDLRERLRRDGPLDPEEATRIALEIAAGLEDAHARKVVHRDLKPANVLLDAEGNVQLADFGIARMLEEPGLTQPGRVLGTGEYVSPEQALGRPVDGRSDLYALGVVLFEMLTGRPPFTGPGFADVAAQHVRSPVPLVSSVAPDVPPALASLVTRCLQKRPEERPTNARQVRLELDAILASLEDEEYETGEHAVVRPAGEPAPWEAAAVEPATDLWRSPTAVDDGAPWDTEHGGASLPVGPRTPPSNYVIEDSALPASSRRDSGAWRWIAVMGLGIALLAGVLAWTRTSGSSDGDQKAATTAHASTAAASTAAADETTDEAPDSTEATAAPVRIVAATSFDPEGDGSERDDLAPLAIDGNLATAWQTEGYKGFSDLARIGKSGVGIEFELVRPAAVTAVTIRTPQPGFTAGIYVSSETDGPTALDDWTPAVAPRPIASAQVRLALPKPTRAHHVLIWITQLAPTPEGDRYTAQISEVRIVAAPPGATTTTDDGGTTGGTGKSGTETDTGTTDDTGASSSTG